MADPPEAPAAEQPAPGWYRNPEGRGQRYWGGKAWTRHYADDRGHVLDVPPLAGMPEQDEGLIPVGYLLALFLPLIGFIIGIVLLTRQQTGHGIGVILVSLIAVPAWAGILTA